ncbi:MAG: glycosyltransferase, partial [Clostridium sp.]
CAGSNTKLKDQLEELKSRTLKKTIIFDYTEKIPELMSISDILISKPGGLTIAESLVKELPIVITSTIPGQEEKNADYLINNGVAARVKEFGELTHLIHQFSESHNRLSHMKEMAREKSKPNSTSDIANLIIKIASSHKS